MRYVLIALFMTLALPLNAQSIYFGYGYNTTTYDYEASEGSTLEVFSPGTGSAFELGVSFPLDRRATMNYKVGLGLSALNASGTEINGDYSWNTKYVGLIQRFSYAVFNPTEAISVSIAAVLGLNSILKGEQIINGQLYDLKNAEDFKGLLVQPGVGVGLAYNIDTNTKFSLGYEFSRYMHVKKMQDKLSFNNHQIQVQLQLNIK